MCNISPGNKCRNGRDGHAGLGWFGKTDDVCDYCWYM